MAVRGIVSQICQLLINSLNLDREEQKFKPKMDEKSGAETGIIPFQEYAAPDFSIAYFEDNLDEFMDLIREENAADDSLLDFGSEIIRFW